jgi:hypothetical protein
MGRSLKTLYPPALTLGDLGNHLTEIWNTIDRNDIRTLISSMGRRCEAVINARDETRVIKLFFFEVDFVKLQNTLYISIYLIKNYKINALLL